MVEYGVMLAGKGAWRVTDKRGTKKRSIEGNVFGQIRSSSRDSWYI